MNDDLVTIATFQIPYHADLAKGMLESAGFEAYLIGDNYGRQSFFHTAYAPIRLQVKSSDEAEARNLLTDLEAGAGSGPVPDIALRQVAPDESALIFSFLTIAARMDESGEPIQKALTDPALMKYWQHWGQPTDVGIVAESAELGYPVGGAWVRLFPGEEPGHGHVSDDIPELAFGVIKELRNQGIGTLLLERLLDDCRTRFPGISLSVRQGNPAVRLYEKLGFRQEGTAFTNRVGTSSMTMLLRFS